MARTQNNTEQHKKAFLAAYASTGTITAAAKIAGVGRGAHYLWLEADKDYAKAFKEAGEEAIDSLEQAARERAFAGSDTLLIFLLKGARPERYRDNARIEHTGKDGGPIQTMDLTRLTDRELEDLERLTTKAGGRISTPQPGSN